MSYRIIESLVLQDAEEITGLLARQRGKSEVVATTLAGCMILFPILAKTYPILERFKDGVWVGLFAPVDEQSDLVYHRIITRLSSDRALAILSDPEIDEQVDAKSRVLTPLQRLVLPPPDRQPPGQDRRLDVSHHRH